MPLYWLCYRHTNQISVEDFSQRMLGGCPVAVGGMRKMF